MRYTAESLLKDEQVVYYSRPHYVVFYSIFIWIGLAIFSYMFIGFVFLAYLMLVMGMISLISDFISYRCTEYVITNKRVLMKVGFIGRRSLEIFINRLESVYISQGVIGRIMNYGTVVICGVGGSKDPFYYIPDPVDFRANVQRQMQDSGSGKQ